MVQTQKRHTVRKRATKRSRNSRNPFRRLPSFLLWGLLGLVVLIYVVFFYKTFVSPYSFRWKALYGTVAYPDGKVRGIDVSHYQEDIDWRKLRRAQLQGVPLSFIFIKATEGTDIIDENFNQNFYNARKNNVVRGAYHFFSTKTPARRQALFFCKIVQLEDEDLPPVLDVEHIGDLSPEKLRSEVHDWMDIVERHYGVTPILYTSYKFKTSYLNTPDFDRYPYWIAHYYVDSLVYKGSWSFWQHTDAGKIDGIRGYVDVNIFNGSYDDLVKMTLGQRKKPEE
jgi:lysozyme